MLAYLGSLIGCFGCIGTFVAPAVLIPRLLRDPFYRSATYNGQRRSYTVADLFVASLMVAMPMCFARLFRYQVGRPDQQLDSVYIGFVVLFGLVGLGAWWASMRTLGRAGVTRQTHRLIYAGVVTPVVWVASIVLPGCVCCFLIYSVVAISDINVARPKELLASGVLSTLCVLTLLGCKRYIRWMFSTHGEHPSGPY